MSKKGSVGEDVGCMAVKREPRHMLCGWCGVSGEGEKDDGRGK